MTVSASASAPVVGDVIALKVTRSGAEIAGAEFRLTSAPSASKLEQLGVLRGSDAATGSVLYGAQNSRTRFETTLSSAIDWSSGEVRFTSGLLAGVSAKVTAFPGPAIIVSALPSVPQPGDRFEVRAANGKQHVSISPDEPGVYTVTAQLFDEFTASPLFDGAASSRQHKIATTTETLTFYAGQELALPVVTSAGSVTLQIAIHGGDVTRAQLVGASNRAAHAAATSTSVVTKLDALVDVAASALGVDLATGVADLIAKYNAHRAQATVHPANDGVNVYVRDRPYDHKDALAQLNTFREVFIAHLTKASSAGARWHTADDAKNAPIVGPAIDHAAAMVLYADLRRCYSAHRTQTSAPAAHDNADATNVLAAIDPLSDLLSTLLDYLAAASPTAPSGIDAGELVAQTKYGFRVVT